MEQLFLDPDARELDRLLPFLETFLSFPGLVIAPLGDTEVDGFTMDLDLEARSQSFKNKFRNLKTRKTRTSNRTDFS